MIAAGTSGTEVDGEKRRREVGEQITQRRAEKTENVIILGCCSS